MGSHLKSCLDKGKLIVESLSHCMSKTQQAHPLSPLPCSPFWTGPLSVSMNLQKQFRRVSRRCNTGVEQQVLMLGQVLGWGLLGSPGTVQQLSLQQGQVGLEKKEADFC